MPVAPHQANLADQINLAMAEQSVWMAAEREKQRQQLPERPDQGWQELATAIAVQRAEQQEQSLH